MANLKQEVSPEEVPFIIKFKILPTLEELSHSIKKKEDSATSAHKRIDKLQAILILTLVGFIGAVGAAILNLN